MYLSKADLLAQIELLIPSNFMQEVSALDIRTCLADIVDSVRTLGETQLLTDAATIEWDVSLGERAFVTLGDNRTLDEPINVQYGQTLVLQVAQDGTGSRLLTWDGFFAWPNETPPILSTGANRVDVFTFQVIDDGGGNKVAVQTAQVLGVFKTGWAPVPE